MPYKPNKMMQADAKRAIEYNESVAPSQRWGTQVGKVRAQQIAKGETLSKDVIMRMFSFLSRHMRTYEYQKNAGKPGKGYYAVLGWGGPSALGWARDKLERYRAAGEL